MVPTCRKRTINFSVRFSAVALLRDLACDASIKREQIDKACDTSTDWSVFTLGACGIHAGKFTGYLWKSCGIYALHKHFP